MADSSSVLKNIPKDKVLEAFERVRTETNIPGLRLELITAEHYDRALEFARDQFVAHEPINKAVGMTWNEEAITFWMSSFKLNLSLMLVDEITEEIVAFRTTRIASKGDVFDTTAIKSRAMIDMIDICVYCDEKADFFGHYGVTEAFHFLGLAVKKERRGCGYASAIFDAAIKMIRYFGFDEVYIKGEGSSNFSKRIYEKAGFEILYDQPFDTYIVDGRRPIQNTGEHKSMKVYGLRVTPNDVK